MTVQSLKYLPRLLIAILLLSGVPLSLSAAIQCWTNNEGVRECGHSVPPEYSQKRIEILNERGIVISVKEAAKTKEQLEEEARLAERKKEEERKAAEQRRQDNILLLTFTTERDLNLAHKNRLQAVSSIIQITNSNTKSLQENLDQLQKQAANYERSGEKAPERIISEMQSLRKQIKDNQAFITRKQLVIDDINKKFAKDLHRFRQLKGIPGKNTQVKSN